MTEFLTNFHAILAVVVIFVVGAFLLSPQLWLIETLKGRANLRWGGNYRIISRRDKNKELFAIQKLENFPTLRWKDHETAPFDDMEKAMAEADRLYLKSHGEHKIVAQ